MQFVPPTGCARKLSRKRTRFGEAPDKEPQPAEDVLAALPWQRVTWQGGTKGKLAARFAAVRIRVGDGPVWGNNRHLPGQEAWLVGEWRTSGERKYCLSNLPRRMSVRALAAATRRVGCASRPISSSRESWANSRGGPGQACTDTR